MLGSLFGLIDDVAKIATAPIEVALDATRIITKPTADIAQEAVDLIKEVKDDIAGDKS